TKIAVAMADSDGEFVDDNLSDDLMDHTIEGEDDEPDHHHTSASGGRTSRSGGKSGSGRPKRGKKDAGGRKKNAAQAWEQSKRTWELDLPEEGEDGTLDLTTLEAEKRRRLMRDTTPLQRGIIRHLVLVLDMSFAMADKDMLPTRYRLTLRYAATFVREFFEQNPISQLGIVGMRDGVAVRVSDLGGNPAEHIERLKELEGQDPQGNPSLQNALEMCRGALFHAPSHGTREVLIIYGALLSSDPGDIHDTITSLISDRIRVSIVGLSAHLSICAELCSRTNAGDTSQYNVVMDEVHFKELFLTATTPPITRTKEQSTPSLLMMGFPSRVLAPGGATSYSSAREGEQRPAAKGVSESGRYACEVCGNHFCIDCDVYAHEIVHNCPGCQSNAPPPPQEDAAYTNGHGLSNGHTNGAMVIDA
ncbi:hypothetical protein LLEC1_06147, partial [Akanthomyces lecanii]